MPSSGPDRRSLIAGCLAMLAGCTTPSAPATTPSVSPSRTPGPSAIPSLTLSPSASPSAGVTPSTMPTRPTWAFRAMTYNILSGDRPASAFPQVKPKYIRFENRLPVLANWIRDAKPDILAIQENEPMRAPIRRPLRRLLPLLDGYRAVQADSNIPILYRSAVFEALQSDLKVLSRKRHVRYGAWCRLQHRDTGVQLLVANTHLDPHQDPDAIRTRKASLRVLTSWLRTVNAGRALPVMLLGDFNTLNDYDDRGRLRGVDPVYDFGLRNSADVAVTTASEVLGAASFNVLGHTVDGTWRYGAIRQDGRTFDYIFVSSPFTVLTWQVVTGPGVREVDGTPYFAAGAVPSDHCPVLAEVSLPLV